MSGGRRLFAVSVLALAPGAQPSLAQSNKAELAPASEAVTVAPAPAQAQPMYRISGDKSLRPIGISDDGVHTYIEWSEDQPLPAVFAVNAQGEEEMVDGYMRGGAFTIDQVNFELIFRIDKKSAKAVRIVGKK